MIVSECEQDLMDCDVTVKVITVNCVGIAGKGIALAAKKKYPGFLRNYKKQCVDKTLTPGGILPYHIGNGDMLLLVATKQHWFNDSRLEWIEQILIKLVANLPKLNGASIGIPPLGCGNGNLDYQTEVRPLLYKYLDSIDNDVYICL